jgi:hypothetical protein
LTALAAFVGGATSTTSLAGTDGGRPSLVEAATEDDEEVQFAITHSLESSEPLPVAESDAIVVGRVLGASCHLARDGTSVLTRFTVRVEEVLKDAAGSSALAGHSLVSVERLGGTIHLPSGRSLVLTADDAALPEVGSRYVFFLACRGANASVLRLYGFREGRVLPSDAGARVGWSETAFLTELRDVILQSR